MNGASSIPEEWRRPVGDAIVPCKQTVTEGLPKTLNELTERTIRLAQEFVSKRSATVEFSEKTSIPEDALSLLYSNEKVMDLLTYDIHYASESLDGLEVVFHYGGEPVLYPGIRRVFKVSLKKNGKIVKGDLEVKGPHIWEISKPSFENDRYKFEVLAKYVENRNEIEVTIKLKDKIHKASFTILGPSGIKGIPAATAAPKD